MIKSPCKDCKDRCANPNCHSTCRAYIVYQNDKRNEGEIRRREGAYYRRRHRPAEDVGDLK